MASRNAIEFDVHPFWKELKGMLEFVRARLQFGQTDVEASKMNAHLLMAYTTLRAKIIKDEVEAKDAARLWFWADCKKALEPVFDTTERTPKGSVNFEDFYACLYNLQVLALSEKSARFWRSSARPTCLPFEKVVKRARSRSPRGLRETCQAKDGGSKGKDKGGGKRKGKGKGIDDLTTNSNIGLGGFQDIWRWPNPPRPLYEGKGFWIFHKHAFWICDTPDTTKELYSFKPKSGFIDGSFTIWITEKYAKQYPFLKEYDIEKGMEYGMLHRLDRETSGPVVVVKNEETFHKLKHVRDAHQWHKEYVCLLHGKVPIDRHEGVIDNYIVTQKHGTSSKTYVFDEKKPNSQKATSIYRVEGYYLKDMPGYAEKCSFTMMKVRIVTGRRHQIRAHMHDFMWKLRSDIGMTCDYGLVSDFGYLDRKTSIQDTEILCRRVFLHECLLGMWDPDNPCRMISVATELPADLQECISKLEVDLTANNDLRRHREILAKQDLIEATCAKYKINAREKQALKEGKGSPNAWIWTTYKTLCKNFVGTFKALAEDGMPSLSIDGDHSFLFERIRRDVEQGVAETWEEPALQKLLETALATHIDDKIWEQSMEDEARSKESALESESLPPDWRRMVDTEDAVYYLHVSGRRAKTPPIQDPDLPIGWVKLARRSSPGRFSYLHIATGLATLEKPIDDTGQVIVIEDQ